MSAFIYNKYSEYLVKKYGSKAYKLPVNINVTCPNRDGNLSTGGCSYCAPEGIGYECMAASAPVREQLYHKRDYIAAKYKAAQFIAYFHNFSNTYLPFADFKRYITEAAQADVCEIAVSTRPDALMDRHIAFLSAVGKQYGIGITIELGLQTVNYHTLSAVGRGHTLAECIDACLRARRIAPEIELCTHLILNLPGDGMADVIESAKIVSVLGVNHVKLHALYLRQGTKMAEDYLNGLFTILPPEEYVRRVVTFIEHLSPAITVQRCIGRAPEDGGIFVNWGMSWKKIQNEIERVMTENNRYQGRLYNYAGGSAFNNKPEFR